MFGLDTIVTILGGFGGALARLIPEIMKFFDAKNERAHELAMQDKQIEFQRISGAQKMDEIRAQGENAWNEGTMEALAEAIKGQDAILPMPGGRWGNLFTTMANVASKMMRPLITIQWVIILYPSVIVATFVLSVMGGSEPLSVLKQVFGVEEKAIVSMILGFWFVDRVLKSKE